MWGKASAALYCTPPLSVELILSKAILDRSFRAPDPSAAPRALLPDRLDGAALELGVQGRRWRSGVRGQHVGRRH